MIWRPKRGQRVRLHYAKRTRSNIVTLHGKCGVVEVTGIGPGPINVLVRLDSGGGVVVSRGNLVDEATEAAKGKEP